MGFTAQFRRRLRWRKERYFPDSVARQAMKLARDGLDGLLSDYLPRAGFFIEVGGYDGRTSSNTYFLENAMGWNGMLIEADPELFEKCRQNRPRAIVLNYALVPSEYGRSTVELNIMRDRSMSSLLPGQRPSETTEQLRTVEVPATPLSELLKHQTVHSVDFLSLDVEGYELDVLKGLDLSTHCPRFMLVECLTTEALDRIQQWLGSHMRLEEQLTSRDYLFKETH